LSSITNSATKNKLLPYLLENKNSSLHAHKLDVISFFFLGYLEQAGTADSGTVVKVL
jgi:hypothetical protein